MDQLPATHRVKLIAHILWLFHNRSFRFKQKQKTSPAACGYLTICFRIWAARPVGFAMIDNTSCCSSEYLNTIWIPPPPQNFNHKSNLEQFSAYYSTQEFHTRFETHDERSSLLGLCYLFSTRSKKFLSLSSFNVQ